MPRWRDHRARSVPRYDGPVIMPNYRYRAMNSSGELVSGAIAAPAPGDVAARIERLGLVLVDNVTLEEGGKAGAGVQPFQQARRWISPSSRLVEKADSQGLAMVRERAPFAPMPSDAQIRFADQVVLIRSPLRVTFSYAGPGHVWQPDWRGQTDLPDMIRVTVRDSATGQVLAVSRAATVHVNVPAECVRAKSAASCMTERSKPVADKKEEQL